MRFQIVQHRPNRHNPVRIDAVVAVIIVPGNLVEMHGFGHPRPLIQRTGIGPEVRIIDDPRPVAFELPMIDRIEPDQRGEQPPIGFGQFVAQQVAVLPQMALQPVQRRK